MKRILVISLAAFLLGIAPAMATPANDMMRDAAPLELGVVTGSNAGATAEPGEYYHLGMRPQRSLWWTWTAPRDGQAYLSTEGSSFDTVLAVYVRREGEEIPGLVAGLDNVPGSTWSTANWQAEAGREYVIALDGRSEGSFRMELRISEPTNPPNPPSDPSNPPSDPSISCSGPVPYDRWMNRASLGTNFRVEVPGERGTSEQGDPLYGEGRTLWFSWIAPSSGQLVVRAESILPESSRIDPLLAGYEVQSGERELLQRNDDWSRGSTSASLVLQVQEGKEYALLLDGKSYWNGGCARIEGELISSGAQPNLPPRTPRFVAGPSGDVSVSSRLNEARFFFEQEEGSSYHCSLDGGPWLPCQSGQAFRGLSLGGHEVRLRDTRGGVQGEVVRSWRFVPRQVEILSGPTRTKSKRAVFRVVSFEVARCRLQGKPWRPCSDKVVLRGVRKGRNVFQIQQTVDGQTSSDRWVWRVL